MSDLIDDLIDDATHAVNNLIPDAVLDRMTADQRSAFLTAVNDALSPIIAEVMA